LPVPEGFLGIREGPPSLDIMSEVNDIKSRLDIVELVSSYVPLQRSGRSYKANCPFHQEKTPSFYVFPDRQTWRCFGACATGGDAFNFVMRAESLEFPEVLRRLAQRTGVALASGGRRGEQQTAFKANDAAKAYFQQRLASSQGAATRDYLAKRGLSPETIEKFGLGLSPRDGESLRGHLVREGFTLEQIALAGLVRQNEQGQHRDLFRGRLMIPIHNGQGHLAGFGARAMDDSQPKYLNSPRSPVFDKGRILYGLHLAREAVREQGIVIVEGYMDAIMAHQYGFNNVVASMGTALTEHQVGETRRLTSQVTLALDPDAAGQQATLRSMESSWRVFQARVAGQSGGATVFQRPEIPELKVALMPEGLDPDEVIRRAPDEWSRLIRDAVPLMEYLFTALSAQLDLSVPQGKARLVELVFPLIAAVPQAAQQDYYFQSLAGRLGISEETLRASVGRPGAAYGGNRRRSALSRQPASAAASASAFARLDRDPVEDYCLALLLQNGEFRQLDGELRTAGQGLRPEHFLRVENREIFNHLSLAAPEDAQEAVLGLLRESIDPELEEHLETLLRKALPPLDPLRRRAVFQEVSSRLEDRHLRALKAEEGLKFAEPSTEGTGEGFGLPEDYQEEVLELNRRIKLNQSWRHSVKLPDKSASPGR